MTIDNDYHYHKNDDINRDAIHARFSSFLQAHELKMTRQREIILDEFMCQDEHVSAEELYDRMKVRHPSVGQATVFRTLRLIAESGLAQELRIDNRTTRYEQNAAGDHHDHIKCLTCNAVFEFHDNRVEDLQREIAARFGVILVRHRMDLFGICENCRKEGKHVPE